MLINKPTGCVYWRPFGAVSDNWRSDMTLREAWKRRKCWLWWGAETRGCRRRRGGENHRAHGRAQRRMVIYGLSWPGLTPWYLLSSKSTQRELPEPERAHPSGPSARPALLDAVSLHYSSQLISHHDRDESRRLTVNQKYRFCVSQRHLRWCSGGVEVGESTEYGTGLVIYVYMSTRHTR